jgi:hypothetical protein
MNVTKLPSKNDDSLLSTSTPMELSTITKHNQ